MGPSIPFHFTLAVQKARHFYGKDLDLDLDETYLSICENLNLDKTQFLETFHSDQLKKRDPGSFSVSSTICKLLSYPSG